MSRRSRNRRKKWSNQRKLKIVILISFLFFLPFIFLFVAGIVFIADSIRELPNLEKQALVNPAQTTKIYASDGSWITDLYAEENRVIVPLSSISPILRDAVISIEDERFYRHHGVDLEAVVRALVVDIKTGRKIEGGSTITQQYVRNIFLTPEKTFKRKIKEAVLAFQVENLYSKDKILEKYLNTVYFGQGCYGIETASQVFFGKSAKDLTLPEAALLAGVIRSPNRYSPYTNPQDARKRRNIVLNKMLELDFITKEEAENAQKSPLIVKAIAQKKLLAPYFVEYVKQILLDKFGANLVFKGGLRVYTTIDLKLQSLAEKAVWETLNKPNDPSASLVAIDPKTGYIKAMVGGRDFSKQKFNLAVQGKRQAGSSFKVFVLTTAIEKGISPSKVYASSPVTIKLPGKDWKVRNATEGSGGEPMTIRQATIHSVNAVFARLIMDVKPENVVKVAKKMGIISPIDPVPAIALGGLRVGVSPLEMASAFGTLANSGIHAKPIAITKVTDVKGKIIFQNKVSTNEAINPVTAYLVNDILEDVIKYGTGRRANIGRPAAGKTGTTQNYRDAWFVGYTPDLACAVWVGYPHGQIEMKNLHGFRRVAGGTIPAQIWAKFMKKAHEGIAKSEFLPLNAKISRIRICVESGLRATPYCPDTSVGIFLKGQGPTKYCNIHSGVKVPNVVGKTSHEARKILKELNLRVNLVEVYSSNIPVGQVVAQEPSAGTKVAEESVVMVKVSKGAAPNQIPFPSFISIPASPKVDETVTFDATSSKDSDGEIVLYSWNFGDGNSGSSQTPQITHNYSSPGTYSVSLTVTDDQGATSSTSLTLTVLP